MSQLSTNTTTLQVHLDAAYLHRLYGGRLSYWLQLVAWGDTRPFVDELLDGAALGCPWVGDSLAWERGRARRFGVR